jgi:hypothetical protein
MTLQKQLFHKPETNPGELMSALPNNSYTNASVIPTQNSAP